MLLAIKLAVTSFVSKNWKWMLPVLALFLTFLFVRNHYYDLGREEERTQWGARIAKEEAKNRKLTDMLETSVSSFAELKDQENDERISREIIRENRISTIVEQKPVYSECKIDQEILDEQNALKELGPRL